MVLEMVVVLVDDAAARDDGVAIANDPRARMAQRDGGAGSGDQRVSTSAVQLL